MEQKNYNFYIAFFFFVYFSFLGHYVLTFEKDTIISYFSEFGFYFYTLLISFYGLLYCYKKIYKNNNRFYNFIINKPSLLIIISLLISHFINIFQPLMKIISYISFKVGYHENFIMFLIGILFFILGAYLIKNNMNKMVLITACMILFIHGFYMCLFWHSTNEQYKAYERLYSVVANNGIMLKECNKDINCLNISKNNFINTVNTFSETLDDYKAKTLVKNYSQGLIEEFQKNEKLNQPLTIYSYGDGIKNFINKSYGAIGIYNSNTGIFILDYKNGFNINHEHEKTYKKLTGIATILWTSLLLILIFFHNTFIHFRRKQILRKSNV